MKTWKIYMHFGYYSIISLLHLKDLYHPIRWWLKPSTLSHWKLSYAIVRDFPAKLNSNYHKTNSYLCFLHLPDLMGVVLILFILWCEVILRNNFSTPPLLHGNTSKAIQSWHFIVTYFSTFKDFVILSKLHQYLLK